MQNKNLNNHMRFHSYVCHKLCSWNYWLTETKKKANGQGPLYDQGPWWTFIFCFMFFSGRVVWVLLQFDLIIFKVFSNLIDSMIHFTWSRSFCLYVDMPTSEFWKGLKVGLFVFATESLTRNQTFDFHWL